MKAIQIKTFGDVDVLEEIEAPTPIITSKQVLIKNHAVAIDPYDVKFIQGLMGEADKLPLIPGSSVVGEVIAVGEDVTDFKIGDRVTANRHHRTYAQAVPVGQSAVAKVPDNVDDAHAVAAALGAATGYQMVVQDLDVQPGQKVLIQGGAGAVGSVAVQAALNRGAEVYATASPANFDYLRSLGDVIPVDYHANYEDTLHEFDAVLDTIGGDVTIKSAKTLKSGGKLRNLTEYDETALSAFDIDIQHAYLVGKRPILAALLADIAAGKINIRIDYTAPFTLDNLKKAHQEARHGSLPGKVILTF